MDHKSKNSGLGSYRGRIIFLGDGSEVLTDGNDTEMFDQEDKDLDSQVSKQSVSEQPAAESEPSEPVVKTEDDEEPKTFAPPAPDSSAESKTDAKTDAKADAKADSKA